MPPPPRYRIEDGRACIDVQVRQSAQLFDLRDPAPFRERDLDEHVVRYLLGSVPEIPRTQPIRVVITIAGPEEPGTTADVIAEAVRSHFTYEVTQVNRRLREHVRRGRIALLLGTVVLAACLGLSNVAAAWARGTPWEVLSEGLVIAGWVAVWRPLEVLLYEWWPLVDERRHVTRILEADLSVRFAQPAPQRALS